MTPSADSATIAAEEAIVPADLLEDGELILLAVKPSGWFVLLVSWPVLAAAGVVTAAAYLAHGVLPTTALQHLVLLICIAAGCLRVVLACFQWLGQLYVLTDRRVIRIRGVIHVDLLACPLKQVRQVVLTAAILERPLHLGSLYFEVSRQHPEDQHNGADASGDPADANWTHIAHAAEIHEIVLNAIRRAR